MFEEFYYILYNIWLHYSYISHYAHPLPAEVVGIITDHQVGTGEEVGRGGGEGVRGVEEGEGLLTSQQDQPPPQLLQKASDGNYWNRRCAYLTNYVHCVYTWSETSRFQKFISLVRLPLKQKLLQLMIVFHSHPTDLYNDTIDCWAVYTIVINCFMHLV